MNSSFHVQEPQHLLYEEDDETKYDLFKNDSDLWMQEEDNDDNILDGTDPLFYSDFPVLPEFPCMSSSSSSSTPAPVKVSTPSSSSSSSAASWAILKPEEQDFTDNRAHLLDQDRYSFNNQEHGQQMTNVSLTSSASMDGVLQVPQASEAVDNLDCMDIMENFGYMDLLENSNDFFDPSSIFYSEEDNSLLEELQKHNEDLQGQITMQQSEGSTVQDPEPENGRNAGSSSDDLAGVFLEWLRDNKETVSAEDLRKVKIKKSTIECAANRLGGGKDGMKQLLKLILQWVQSTHLHKRHSASSDGGEFATEELGFQNLPPELGFQCPSPAAGHATSSNMFFNPNEAPNIANPGWCGQVPQYVPPEGMVPGYPPPYMADPYGNGPPCNYGAHGFAKNPVECGFIGSSQAPWANGSGYGFPPRYSSFPDNGFNQYALQNPPQYTGYGNQFCYHQPCLPVHGGAVHVPGGENGLMKLCSSATKEARKKRMARQRKIFSHHKSQQNAQSSANPNLNQTIDQHAGHGSDSSCVDGAGSGKWLSWSPTSGSNTTSQLASGNASLEESSSFQRQLGQDKRQGWKTEKNLKFLLQKVLKQSDVGNLGRIVLPKKEAETHLPELEQRDGISLEMEDIGTSRVWNMRYRFWPNNKSRMYLLENTGDFVRTNGLQEGDFIVLYSDMKSGKYLIRGVKVRQQQQGQKVEIKRPAKVQKKGYDSSPDDVNNVVESAVSMPVI